jgi:hypothetical protein
MLHSVIKFFVLCSHSFGRQLLCRDGSEVALASPSAMCSSGCKLKTIVRRRRILSPKKSQAFLLNCFLLLPFFWKTEWINCFIISFCDAPRETMEFSYATKKRVLFVTISFSFLLPQTFVSITWGYSTALGWSGQFSHIALIGRFSHHPIAQLQCIFCIVVYAAIPTIKQTICN